MEWLDGTMFDQLDLFDLININNGHSVVAQAYQVANPWSADMFGKTRLSTLTSVACELPCELGKLR